MAQSIRERIRAAKGRTRRRLRAQIHSRSVAARNERKSQRARRRRKGKATRKSAGYRVDKSLVSQATSKVTFDTAFPDDMSMETNPVTTITFFQELRQRTLIEPAKRVHIDHSTIQKMSPETALVLIAELARAHQYAPRCRKTGEAVKDRAIQQLLGQIGYLRYFGLDWDKTASGQREFLSHMTSHRVEQEQVWHLIDYFEPVVHLEPLDKKMLYNALVECMTNVMAHAYRRHGQREPLPRKRPFAVEQNKVRDCYLYKQWWLLGIRDKKSKEVSFCFYDQGRGIPTTIRFKIADKLYISGRSDEDLIIEAVTEGHFSRTRDPNRGQGLPSLKFFIDQAGAGQLMIVTDRSKCVFKQNDVIEQEKLNVSLPGTLIVWTLGAKK